MRHFLKIISTMFEPYGINKSMQILYQKPLELLQIKENLSLTPRQLIYPRIWQLRPPPMAIASLGRQVLKVCRLVGVLLPAVMMRTLLYTSKGCLWLEIVLLEPLQFPALSQHLLHPKAMDAMGLMKVRGTLAPITLE
jgi:hypothetical protein